MKAARVISRSGIALMACGFLAASLTGCTTAVETVIAQHPKARALFSAPKPDLTLTGKGWTNSVGESTNTITVLHLQGDNYYSLGYQHGKLLGPKIKATYDEALTGAEKLIPKE